MANVVMLFMGDMESSGHSIKCQATELNVYINKFAVYAFWCLEMGSNHLRLALQANALPVELSKHLTFNFLNIL